MGLHPKSIAHSPDPALRLSSSPSSPHGREASGSPSSGASGNDIHQPRPASTRHRSGNSSTAITVPQKNNLTSHNSRSTTKPPPSATENQSASKQSAIPAKAANQQPKPRARLSATVEARSSMHAHGSNPLPANAAHGGAVQPSSAAAATPGTATTALANGNASVGGGSPQPQQLKNGALLKDAGGVGGGGRAPNGRVTERPPETRAAAAAAQPQLVTRRKKAGRLRRAWTRFKRMATCANVHTFDSPLHGLPLEAGEGVITTDDPLPAGVAAAACAPTVAATAATAASGPVSSGDAAALTATDQALPRESSSGSDRSARQHTGYLTTPGQWGTGSRYDGGGAGGTSLTSDANTSSAAATVGSSVRLPDPNAPAGHAIYGANATEDNDGVSKASGGAGGGHANRAVRHGGAAAAEPAAPLVATTPAAAATGPHRDPVERTRDSLCSMGSVEDEFYDARSVASTFSVMSSVLTAAAEEELLAAAHLQQQQHQGLLPMPLRLSAMPPDGSSGRRASQEGRKGEYKLEHPVLLAQPPRQAVQALQPTTPPQPRRPEAAATSPPIASSDNNALTGQFSTSVLDAPHRTGSNAASLGPTHAAAGAAAAGKPVAAAAAAAPDEGVTAAPRQAELDALPLNVAPQPVSLHDISPLAAAGLVAAMSVRPSPAATPRAGAPTAPRLGVKPRPAGPAPPGEELPSWVPAAPIPGMDPATLFVPVPADLGVAGYWAKVPELSAPNPLPIDVALNANRMARTAHESIRGILLREHPTELVLKARLTLPLGIKMTHQEHYPRDNSVHVTMVRRDVKPGRSLTRMYYTADGDVLLVCESTDVYGKITHVGFELMHMYDHRQMIRCRQWVLIVATGKMVEQYFVGRRGEIPH